MLPAADLAAAIHADNPSISVGELSTKIAIAMTDDGFDFDAHERGELDRIADAAAARELEMKRPA